MNRLYILLLLIGITSGASAETLRALNQADLFANNTENTTAVKCGTPLLMNMLHDGAGKLSAFASEYMQLDRPELDTYRDSAQKHFRVHYNLTGTDAPNPTDADLNGVPDYVDSALVYLETAWNTVIKLGYGAPRSDNGSIQSGRGGSDATDVYIQELSPQRIYGYTSPDGYLSVGSSYMVVDNDFKESIYPTKGYAALKVTTAHEFFHVIHYSYYGGDDAIWWMEQSAVWMEDQVWDDVNDYINYLFEPYGIFLNRYTPIDTNGPFMYTASPFAFMIAKKYGKDTIRTIWNAFRDHQSGSIEQFNSILPGGLTQAMLDLGVWMYFTGQRANSSAFFADSALFNSMVSPQDTIAFFPASDSLSCKRYTFKYAEISPHGGFSASDSLLFQFFDRNGGVWKKQLILYNSPTDFESVSLTGSEPSLLFEKSFSKAVLVVSNAIPNSGTYRLACTIREVTGTAPVFHTISGTVVGASGVVVRLRGDSTESTLVDSDGGSYSFTVAGGGTYTVSAERSGFSLTPSSYTITGIASDQTLDFTASQIITLSLGQNYPNPFKKDTNLRFTLPSSSRIRLSIANIAGQTVRTLIDGWREGGSYTVPFDASGLSSGIYFAIIESGGKRVTRTIALIK
jgi:hypothetical protein